MGTAYDRPVNVGVVAILVIVGYALGTFPSAVLVGRRLGFDPTAEGSGNPGASNTTRIGGPRAGAIVLLGDLGKGVAAAGLGLALDGPLLGWIVGSAAVAGHLWPVTRGFKGGKGVATVAGVVLVCAPVVFAGLALVFGVLVKVTGKAAVGSIVVAVLVPTAIALVGRPGAEVSIAAVIAGVVIVRHRENIARLRAGTESDVRS